MKVKPQAAIFAVIAIFIIGIAGSSALGLWKTQTTKVPVKLADEQYAGAYNPADIKGSYTFADISTLFNIPLKDLAAAFGIPEADASTFKCKDLEAKYGDSKYSVGTDSVKMFTAYYLGLPFTPASTSYLPAAAAQILKNNGKMTPEQKTFLEIHTVPAS